MVTFKEPPPQRRMQARARTVEILRDIEELKSQPGVWALVCEFQHPDNNAGAYARAKGYKVRGCDTRVAALGRGKYEIYARWPEGGA